MCVYVCYTLIDHVFYTNICYCVVAEGSARPLFPQWSHHVYPQFLPGTHPNAAQHQHNYTRHRHSYIKHHYNLNNNHHSHHYNHKVDHRYHRNSITSHQGNLVHGILLVHCFMSLIFLLGRTITLICLLVGLVTFLHCVFTVCLVS